MQTTRSVSVVVSGTVVLTRSCREACAYCGFRRDDDPLVPLSRLGDQFAPLAKGRATEVVLAAGQSPAERPHVLMALARDKCTSFGEYLHQACRMALEHGLLPVLQVGWLTPLELKTLAPVAASVRIPVLAAPLDGEGQAHAAARGRRPATAREAIEKAHQAGLPYHLDFLIGLGESAEERRRTVQEIGAFCAADPWLQDVRAVPFQPVPGTPFRARPPLPFDEVRAMIIELARAFPVHALSVPIHLFARYPELIGAGLNDLGSTPIVTGDPIMPTFPVPGLELVKSRLVEAAGALYERLPLTTPVAVNRPGLAEALSRARDRLQARAGSGLALLDNRKCFVCGDHNPDGLQIAFRRHDADTCTATWVPGAAFQGYAGIVHGGLLSTLLDEAMAHCLNGAGRQVVTADLRVRFLRPVPVGLPLTVTGTRTGHRQRIHFARGTVTGPDGTLLAEAEGRFAEC
ncbi:MAG: 1,4-dihydroxy-2-naphthoyl-CoA hydrolase [Candidatus Ozemobacter sibiricus]|jgi:7,8-didemethyl-8-hydroxy-5-deazariboflavin synthase CofG subunit|uniref:Acyl-coenzyme A thioesterase THEM4 n=1 Tax=Candidatus Ozemobacter sibiricus TaxID=2268124 RepID=A0A367ZQM5_9BACT|nr:MAG: 1,4-dihydroxy-2-naphthoyl-CoA hydrolase [Candidatus Ozemobacter sibiricus]